MTAGDLLLADVATRRDLATYVARARRIDPDGGARLVGHGTALAVYVGALSGGGGPTVLGLRVVGLAEPADLDATVPLAALADRFARDEGGSSLAVPPVTHPAPWAGVAPPRSGWAPLPPLPADTLRAAAVAGISEVAAGTPDVAGAAAVARLRASVWGRTLDGTDDVPAGAGFAAHALGFLTDEPVGLHAVGPWRRLSTDRGHVLSRRPALG